MQFECSAACGAWRDGALCESEEGARPNKMSHAKPQRRKVFLELNLASLRLGVRFGKHA